MMDINMTKLKHTKGNWKLIDMTSAAMGVNIIAGKDSFIGNIKTLSDAKLIITSPKLLKALIDNDIIICDLCKRLNPQHKNCTICDDRQDRLNLIFEATK